MMTTMMMNASHALILYCTPSSRSKYHHHAYDGHSGILGSPALEMVRRSYAITQVPRPSSTPTALVLASANAAQTGAQTHEAQPHGNWARKNSFTWKALHPIKQRLGEQHGACRISCFSA